MLEIQALRKCITRDHLAMDPGAGCIGPGSAGIALPYHPIRARRDSFALALLDCEEGD
jgi:hypothetical protein